MQMDFSNTPLDVKSGDTIYLLVYSGKRGVWYSPVTFSELKVDESEDKWTDKYGILLDKYTLISTYINDKDKKKEIKVKWYYSKENKPIYKKSKNFIYIEDTDVTCTPIEDSSIYYNVYITSTKEKMSEYIKENKIFENAIAEYNKQKRIATKHMDDQIERISNYDI